MIDIDDRLSVTFHGIRIKTNEDFNIVENLVNQLAQYQPNYEFLTLEYLLHIFPFVTKYSQQSVLRIRSSLDIIRYIKNQFRINENKISNFMSNMKKYHINYCIVPSYKTSIMKTAIRDMSTFLDFISNYNCYQEPNINKFRIQFLNLLSFYPTESYFKYKNIKILFNKNKMLKSRIFDLNVNKDLSDYHIFIDLKFLTIHSSYLNMEFILYHLLNNDIESLLNKKQLQAIKKF